MFVEYDRLGRSKNKGGHGCAQVKRVCKERASLCGCSRISHLDSCLRENLIPNQIGDGGKNFDKKWPKFVVDGTVLKSFYIS